MASPRGGPRADVGEYGDFMGTLQQNFCPYGGENVGTKIFECPTLWENVGTLLLYNCEEIGNDRLFARSMVRWQRRRRVEGMFFFCQTIYIYH